MNNSVSVSLIYRRRNVMPNPNPDPNPGSTPELFSLSLSTPKNQEVRIVMS